LVLVSIIEMLALESDCMLPELIVIVLLVNQASAAPVKIKLPLVAPEDEITIDASENTATVLPPNTNEPLLIVHDEPTTDVTVDWPPRMTFPPDTTMLALWPSKSELVFCIMNEPPDTLIVVVLATIVLASCAINKPPVTLTKASKRAREALLARSRDPEATVIDDKDDTEAEAESRSRNRPPDTVMLELVVIVIELESCIVSEPPDTEIDDDATETRDELLDVNEPPVTASDELLVIDSVLLLLMLTLPDEIVMLDDDDIDIIDEPSTIKLPPETCACLDVIEMLALASDCMLPELIVIVLLVNDELLDPPTTTLPPDTVSDDDD